MTKNDIIPIISERTGVSRSDVRLFLDKFNETLFQALGDDQQVKIKGLGTFKMVSVKARKSVSVNGGEAIEIPAHNKVTFTADKVFAEMVNEPLAHLEVVELSSDEDDPAEEGADDYMASSRMKKLDDDAAELKGLLADINGLHEVAVEEPEEESESLDGQERPDKLDEPEKPEEPEAPEEPERPVVSEQPVQPIYYKPDDDIDEEEERKTGMTHGGKMGRIFLWVMVLLLIIVGSIYWVNFKKKTVVPVEEERPPVVVQREPFAPEAEETETEDTLSESQIEDIPVAEKKVAEKPVVTKPVAEKPIVVKPAASEKVSEDRLTIAEMRAMKIDYSTLQGTETVRDGSRLTMIALRAYGSKDFWIYLFLANNDQLSNPGQISTGMVIKIPKLDRRLIDASNPDCLQYAMELQSKYVK